MLTTVVLVDADFQAATSIRQMLEQACCAVTSYASYLDLFHDVPNCPIDAVILNLDGWTIREQAITHLLREHLEKYATRFVLIADAVYSGIQVPEAVDALVLRPFSEVDLMRAVAG